MFPKILLTFLLVFSAGSLVNSQGRRCRTPNNEIGVCINIVECRPLLNLLTSASGNPQVREYLLRSTCEYVGSTPIVCCPGQSRVLPTQPTRGTTQRPVPVTTTKTTQRPTTTTASAQVGGLLTPPACGYANVSDGRVVGGMPANKGEFPWITALGYKNSKNPDSPKWLCGGSLITTRHILTAGHCVHNRNDLYLARLGDLDLYSDTDGATPQTIPIMARKIHEEYSPTSFTNDIAILTLEQSPSIPGVWPICLPLEDRLRLNNFAGFSPIVAGWGSIYFNGPSSALLQKVQLPVVTEEKCKTAFANFKTTVIDQRVLCAGFPSGGKDSCQGDSGGPLMFPVSQSDNNLYYQIGVVSYGFRCAEPGYYGVYSRVTAFLDWIARNVQ